MELLRLARNRFYLYDFDTIEATAIKEYEDWSRTHIDENDCYTLDHETISMTLGYKGTSLCIAPRFSSYIHSILYYLLANHTTKERVEMLVMVGYIYYLYFGRHDGMPYFSEILLDMIGRSHDYQYDHMEPHVTKLANIAIHTLRKGHRELLLDFTGVEENVEDVLEMEMPNDALKKWYQRSFAVIHGAA